MNAARDNLTFYAGCALAIAYDAWNTATELAGAWLARQFQQVGNAVPPRLAAHVLAALTGAEMSAAA